MGGGNERLLKLLDYLLKVSEIFIIMGRGRKQRNQKMKNRKNQAAKKTREKKRRESVHKSRMA
jgi:hypothetical protein